MRIVGGKYRGKKLQTPEGRDVRPTSERAREAIFNILYSKLGGDYSGLNLLDIFCGTGAFGFEALSRGFKHVTFVDKNTTLIQKNAKLFVAEKERFDILQNDATRLSKSRRLYDLVFMDAPYALGLSEIALQQLLRQNWLNEHAICIVEVRNDERWPLPQGLELLDERVYGLARVLFLRKN